MIIGLVIVNVVKSGSGLHIDPAALSTAHLPNAGRRAARGLHRLRAVDHPENLMSALTGEEILPVHPEQGRPAREPPKLGARGDRSPTFDKTDHHERHAVGCCVNRLTKHPAGATRYDELAVLYEATVLAASTSGCEQLSYETGQDDA